MKIMLDTNILVSMIFFPTDKTNLLKETLVNNHSIILCDYVIEELRMVVQRKFPTKENALETFLIQLPFELVNTPRNTDYDNIPSVRDKKDTPILAAAIRHDVDIFITGDLDFLVLADQVQTPLILTMSQFINFSMFSGNTPPDTGYLLLHEDLSYIIGAAHILK